MVFYVYGNWVAEGHKATIHQGCCGFCNNGKGAHACTNSINGKWRGPYQTSKEALNFAQSKTIDVRRCGFCASFQ